MKNESVPPALLLVDIQQGFDELAHWGGERNNPFAEENAAALLAHWRGKRWPLFHIRHCSLEPRSPLRAGLAGNAFKKAAEPRECETVICKNVHSAFTGTDLQRCLYEAQVDRVVIAGLTTDHCVSTTARMAADLGLDVFVASDATATFCRKGFQGEQFPADLVHRTALASLNAEFATVLTTSQLIGRFADPAFLSVC